MTGSPMSSLAPRLCRDLIVDDDALDRRHLQANRRGASLGLRNAFRRRRQIAILPRWTYGSLLGLGLLALAHRSLPWHSNRIRLARSSSFIAGVAV